MSGQWKNNNAKENPSKAPPPIGLDDTNLLPSTEELDNTDPPPPTILRQNDQQETTMTTPPSPRSMTSPDPTPHHSRSHSNNPTPTSTPQKTIQNKIPAMLKRLQSYNKPGSNE